MVSMGQEPLSYSAVEKAEGMTAGEIFISAKSWIATAYGDAQSVIQMAEDNKIIAKGNHLYNANNAHNKIEYVLTVECRDGRYKLTLNSMNYSCSWMSNPRIFEFGVLTDAEDTDANANFFGKKVCLKLWQKAKDESKVVYDQILEGIKESMAKDLTSDDW